MRVPFAKLCYPLAGGLAATARGDGALRGRFARVTGLARNPIRAGPSQLIVVTLVYAHLDHHIHGVHGDDYRCAATTALAGLRAIREIA